MFSCFIAFQFNLKIQIKLQLEIQERTTHSTGKINNNNNILLYILEKYEITALSVTEIHFQRRRAEKQSFNPAQ